MENESYLYDFCSDGSKLNDERGVIYMDCSVRIAKAVGQTQSMTCQLKFRKVGHNVPQKSFVAGG